MRAYSDKSYRNYFKKVKTSWTNPFVTSNTNWGTITKMDTNDSPISDSNMYKAFNGSDASGSTNTYEFWKRTTFRIKWKMPERVRVNKVQMWGSNAKDTYYSVTKFIAWGWDYSINAYKQLCSGTWGAETGVTASWNVTEIETDLFRFEVTGKPTDEDYRPTALREIRLSGYNIGIEKGTANDYDYYIDSPEIKVRKGDFLENGVMKNSYQALGYTSSDSLKWMEFVDRNK